MMVALYAEFRKLLSVRSTWILSIIGLLFAGFLGYWAHGLKGGPVFESTALQNAALNEIVIVSIFSGIVAILLICHEYRYNTIGYTLTASNNRMKVLLAKFLVIAGYSVALTVVSCAVIIGSMALGARVAGTPLGAQSIDLYALLWKTSVFMITTGWLGLLLGFLSRSIVFAIVAYFVLPVLEQMTHLLLKVSTNYLPTMAQGQILQAASSPGMYSPLASAGMFGLYLLGAFIVAMVLFLRKDAN